jgi:hypothetical protein
MGIGIPESFCFEFWGWRDVRAPVGWLYMGRPYDWRKELKFQWVKGRARWEAENAKRNPQSAEERESDLHDLKAELQTTRDSERKRELLNKIDELEAAMG